MENIEINFTLEDVLNNKLPVPFIEIDELKLKKVISECSDPLLTWEGWMAFFSIISAKLRRGMSIPPREDEVLKWLGAPFKSVLTIEHRSLFFAGPPGNKAIVIDFNEGVYCGFGTIAISDIPLNR